MADREPDGTPHPGRQEWQAGDGKCAGLDVFVDCRRYGYAESGNNAVAKVRAIVGATSPEQAAPGTIRGDLSTDSYALSDLSARPIQNLIHASGSVEEGRREAALWFTQKELHSYKRTDESLIYRRGE